MNALNRAFGKSWKGKSFKPNWKTLTVVGPNGEFLGRTKYSRKRHTHTGNMNTAPAADWECTIQIPTEIYNEVMKNFIQAWENRSMIKLQGLVRQLLMENDLSADDCLIAFQQIECAGEASP